MTHLSVLDIGLTRDHCAGVTVHRDPSGIVVVDHIFHRVGTKLLPVQFSEIETWVGRMSSRFGTSYTLLADQWQSRQLLQRMKARGIRTGEIVFGAPYHDRIARNLLEMVRDRRIRCFHHEGLLTQLKHVVLKRSTASGRDDTSVKVKIDSGAGVGVAGKDDLVVALASAAFEITEGRRWSTAVAIIRAGEAIRDAADLDFCRSQDAERRRPQLEAEALRAEEREAELVAKYGRETVRAIRAAAGA